VSSCVFAIRLCVISTDGCRKVCLSYLVFSCTGSVWPPQIHAESSDHSVPIFLPSDRTWSRKDAERSGYVCWWIFLWFFLQIVGDLARYIRKGVLMMSPCVSTHSQYVISSGRSSKVCSRCLLVSLTDCVWCLLINSMWRLLMFLPKGCTSFLFLGYI
jgi:hypothetical protein